MIEIAVAALAPVAILWVVVRWCGPHLRAAARRWFIPLVLLWFAPCWLTGRTPAAYDYLAQEVWPWKQADFRAGNALLSDVPMQFAPWREVVTRAYRSGQLPLLNRYAGSGSPLWENPQAAVLYPLTIAGIPFSTFAWPLFSAVSKLLIALCGTYLFVRSLGATHNAAIFGAIAYGFSAFTVAFLLFPHTNVTVLLPWLLLAIDGASQSWRGAAAFAVVLFLLFSGGHPESVLHAAFIAIPYALRHWRAAGRIAAGGVAGCLLAAPLLIPFALLLPSMERTARIAREATLVAAPRLTIANLGGFVFPYALSDRRSPDAIENFNEVATQYAGFAAFVLMILAALRAPRRNAFWIVTFVTFACLAFRSDLFDGVPLFGETLHGRVRFLLAFITAVLGARGFDLTASVPFRRILPFLLASDLALLLLRYNPPVSRDFFYPPTPALRFLAAQPHPFRFLGVDSTLLPNSSAMLKLEDVGVHDPTSFELYGATLERAGYDRRIYFNGFRRLPPKALLDHLGVRFVVAPPGVRSSALPSVYRGLDATIFFNPYARARFYEPLGTATVITGAYRANEAEIHVRSASATEILSGEVSLPGWRLRRGSEAWPLDKSAPFLRWRAPAGESRFQLRYVPVGLAPGVACAALGMAILATFWRLGKRGVSASPAAE